MASYVLYGGIRHLQAVYESGGRLTKAMLEAAVRKEDTVCLDFILQYIRREDYRVPTLIHRAVESGRLDSVRLLHANGFSWDGEAIRLAVRFGHLDCLVFMLRHNPQTFDVDLFLVYETRDYKKCLDLAWAHESRWRVRHLIPAHRIPPDTPGA